MTNVVSSRVGEFLQKNPPFNLIPKYELEQLSESVLIKYLNKGMHLFSARDEPHQYFYILKEGIVVLKNAMQNTSFVDTTIDICDEGELFGLRPLIAKDEYLMTAIAEEESIIYGIPIDVFKPIIESNPKISIYLVEVFASKTKNPYYSEYLSNTYKDYKEDEYKLIDNMRPVRYQKQVITCHPEMSIKEAAQMMKKKNVGSIIVVNQQYCPMSIVTVKDLAYRVATGKTDIQSPISEVMSANVQTFTEKISVVEAQIKMITNGISYLCITEDGTTDTPVIGILSEHDLIVSQANTVVALMKAIKRASKSKELRRIRNKVQRLLKGYIQNNLSISLIFKVMHQINEAIVYRAIELSLKKMSPSPVKFAWLSLGSHGRSEQFLLTDQDNAIVFEDVPDEQYDQTKAFFMTLGEKVNKRLNTVGYEYCPANMMARNSKWCLSLSEWKGNFKKWTSDSDLNDLLLCSIFFDYHRSYGDKEIIKSLSSQVIESLKGNSFFLLKLSKAALEKPSPVGFFKQFIVERNGEHKNSFDLKARAIMPLVDIARLLMLGHQILGVTNTADRFEKLAELEPQNKEIYHSCVYAIKSLLKFRTKFGIANSNSGRYIDLKTLSKEERIKLKNSFNTIDSVQELVKNRYRITN